jgi:hypothetical protein
VRSKLAAFIGIVARPRTRCGAASRSFDWVRTEIETLVLRGSTLRRSRSFSSSNSRKPTDITRRNRPAGREICEICTKKEHAVADETSTAEAVNQKQVRLDEPKRERRERRERREHRLGGEPGPQSGEKRLRDTGGHPK